MILFFYFFNILYELNRGNGVLEYIENKGCFKMFLFSKYSSKWLEILEIIMIYLKYRFKILFLGGGIWKVFVNFYFLYFLLKNLWFR